MAGVPAHLIMKKVPGDGAEPGEQLTVPPEGFSRPDRPEEGLLRDFFRQVFRSGQGHHIRIDAHVAVLIQLL